MLTTFDDIKTDVIEKLGIETTSAYYTDTILNSWIQQGTRFASSYKKWPFTEGRVETTFVSGTEEWQFEGYKADSIRFLTIGGERLQKLNFEDYVVFKDKYEDDSDKVFSDYGRILYVNPKIDLSGTLVAFGQYEPVDIDVTDLSAETVFSNGDEEGNEAIVEQVLGFAATREMKESEAQYHFTRARQILDDLWLKVRQEQSGYHGHRARGGMFKRVDVINGNMHDEEFRRDQF